MPRWIGPRLPSPEEELRKTLSRAYVRALSLRHRGSMRQRIVRKPSLKWKVASLMLFNALSPVISFYLQEKQDTLLLQLQFCNVFSAGLNGMVHKMLLR